LFLPQKRFYKVYYVYNSAEAETYSTVLFNGNTVERIFQRLLTLKLFINNESRLGVEYEAPKLEIVYVEVPSYRPTFDTVAEELLSWLLATVFENHL